MTRKTTLEDFIAKSKEKHGACTYDYSKVIYVNNRTRVKLVCKKHGEFLTTPDGHIGRGYGCRKCAEEASSERYRHSLSDFISSAKKVHCDLYDYSNSEYKGYHTKLEIICRKHGSFLMTPASHCQGQNCPQCALIMRGEGRRISKQEFVERSTDIHNNFYDYTLSDFSKHPCSTDTVEIVCPVHGTFMQGVTSHLQGRGCPQCSVFGFKRDRQGKLYILKSDNITKIGITNLSVSKRSRDISRSSGKLFSEVLHINFKNGSVACETETEVLRILRSKYKGVDEVFDGYTECFIDVDLKELLTDIVNVSHKHMTKLKD